MVRRVVMHREVKLGIVILLGGERFTHLYLRGQFLTNLTSQSIFCTFPRFNFSSRELPLILPLAIPTLSGEDATLTKDDGRNDLYFFTWHIF